MDKRVRIIRMEDPYTNLKSGDEGTISGEDGFGHILVKWDNGSTLHLIPEIDEFEILEQRFIKSFESFGFNPNKGIKELKSESTFIESKLEELSDLVSSFQTTIFEWSTTESFLEINFEIGDQDVQIRWDIDLDKMQIDESTIHNGEEDIWFDKISSIDEAIHIVEKEIHYWLDISENKYDEILNYHPLNEPRNESLMGDSVEGTYKYNDLIKFKFDRVDMTKEEFSVHGTLTINSIDFDGYMFGYPGRGKDDDYEASEFKVSSGIFKREIDFDTYISNKIKISGDEFENILLWLKSIYDKYSSSFYKKPLEKEYFLEIFSDILDNGWEISVSNYEEVFWNDQARAQGIIKRKYDYIINLERQTFYKISKSIFQEISDDMSIINKSLEQIRSLNDISPSGVIINNSKDEVRGADWIFPNKITLMFNNL
jgi:hypothetical protein